MKFLTYIRTLTVASVLLITPALYSAEAENPETIRDQIRALMKDTLGVDYRWLTDEGHNTLGKLYEDATSLLQSDSPTSSALNALQQRLDAIKSSITFTQGVMQQAELLGLQENIRFLPEHYAKMIRELYRRVPESTRLLEISGQFPAIYAFKKRAAALLSQTESMNIQNLTEQQILPIIIAGIDGGRDDKEILQSIAEKEKSRESKHAEEE